MKNWKPPLPPDKWYAHIFRSLLKRNSRRRAGMTDKVKEAENFDKDGLGNPIMSSGTMANATPEQLAGLDEHEEAEEEFHWRYALLEKKHGGETYYHVCEEYPGLGYTGAETPMGDTPEELQTVLEMMLEDVKGAIAHKNIIVDGAPYDNWREKELDEGETIPWDDVKDDLFGDLDDIGNDPTLKVKVEDE